VAAVADRYIDVAYVDSCIGSTVRDSLVGDGADPDELLELLTLIERKTNFVQGYLRNSGYSCPVTQSPADVSDATVKDAVMCLVWEALAFKPNNSIPLPDGWATGTYRLALEGILSGTVQLNLPQGVKSSVGGITASARVSRARQEDLGGW
jgi:hypothetical protein